MPPKIIQIISSEEVQKSEYTEKRDCYQYLEYFIADHSRTTYGKICALYGLRRSGKTVMMEQYISSLPQEERKKAFYLSCGNDSKADMDVLYDCLDDLIEQGAKYIFIDEITCLHEFQVAANFLSDYYGKKAKIVIAGTDSLGIRFAMSDTLYDRVFSIHTTWIPYDEWARLLNGKTIDDYICCGGLLAIEQYRDKHHRDEYLNTSIIDNIMHSMMGGHEGRKYFSALSDLYDEELLRSVINEMINRFSYDLVLRAISKKYANVQTKSMQSSREALDTKEVYEKTKVALEIPDFEEMKMPIQDEHVNVLKRYLKELDLFMTVPSYLSLKRGIRLPNMEIFLQPGMVYAHSEELLKQLADNEEWRTECSMEERQVFLNQMDELVKEEILENILISETFQAIGGKRFYVSQLSASELSDNLGYSGNTAEADMIIVDIEENKVYLFEIMHSSLKTTEQVKHLQNKEFIRFVNENFGEVKKTCVIYNGSTQISNDDPTIQYLNAEKFLHSIHEMAGIDNKQLCIEELFRMPAEKQPIEMIDVKPLIKGKPLGR